jgi:hypothetical protein
LRLVAETAKVISLELPQKISKYKNTLDFGFNFRISTKKKPEK